MDMESGNIIVVTSRKRKGQVNTDARMKQEVHGVLK